MGGVFGKNKRLRAFPKTVIIYKARGKKASKAAPVFCDASTWTGENHFHSARIGRTPKVLAPKSESPALAEQDPGEQAVFLHTQHAEVSLPVTARDAQDVEVSQDAEAKPSTEVMQHQEAAEETKQEAHSERRSPQEGSEAEAVLHRISSCRSNEQLNCENREASPVTQSIVKADVHVSADVQSGPGKVQPATAESEPLALAEQGAGVLCASEETCGGKTHQEVPVQKAADSPAPLCTPEESELPWRATGTAEDDTNVLRSAEEEAVEEQGNCAPKAPLDLQLEQDIEDPITEDIEENAFEPEQAEEMAEVCDDGQTSENPASLAETQAVLQDKEINDSSGAKPEEH